MKISLKNDLKVFAAVTAAVTAATLTGGAIGAWGAIKGPSIESSRTSDIRLAKAVHEVYKVSKKGTPNLKAPIYFTDFDFIEENGHAKSAPQYSDCEVVINNKVVQSEFNQKVKKATGWDDTQIAIFVAAHELQHCVTMSDVHKVIFNKSALSEREAEALHAFVWGTGIAETVAKHPGNSSVLHKMSELSESPVYLRANESISDVTGLIMVQQLSPKGLTVDAVEGLRKVRMETSPDPIYSGHHTAQALEVLATKLHLDESFGKYIAPQHVAQVAYQIVGMAKPESEYTKTTVADIKKARDEYIASNTTHDM